MSPQHDYIIDNSTGANVRSDINSVLQAIASNNSGSSAPSTTYAFQLFADTTNNVMKIRNSANNAFIELFQLDGTFTLEDGSASTPALAFRDDLNTGIFSSGADTFNVATGGAERMALGAATVFNEGGANVDFRIEGDTDPNLFYLDAGNDRVGISTSSPQSLLEVDTNDATFALKLTCNENVSGSYNGLSIAGNDENSGSYPLVVVSNSTTHETGGHPILCCNQRRVGISTLSPTETLHLGASGTDQVRSIKIDGTNGSSELQGVILESDGANARFNIKMGIGGGTPSTKFTVLPAGGITFNGDTAEANALQDYEEGTFTMHFNVEGESNLGGVGRVGEYVKIGRIVHIIGGITCGSVSGATTSKAIDFTNLPFAMVNTGIGSTGHPFPVNFLDLDSTGLDEMVGSQPYVFGGRLNNNSTGGRIVAYKADGDQNPQNASKALKTNSQIYCMFTYVTAA